MPSLPSRPGVGLRPTMLLKPAGTRPDPRRVGSQREAHESRRDRDCRSRTRAARHERRIERIARHAIRRAHTDESGRELIEVRLADDDGAGGDQPLHDFGGSLCVVGETRTGRRRGHARDVDIVPSPRRARRRSGSLSISPRRASSTAACARRSASAAREIQTLSSPALRDALQHLVDGLPHIERAGAVGAEGVNAEVEKGCHASVVDKRHTDCSHQIRAVMARSLPSRQTRKQKRRSLP